MTNPLDLLILGEIVNHLERILVDEAHKKDQSPSDRAAKMLIKEVGLIATRAIRSGDSETVVQTISALISSLAMLTTFYTMPDSRLEMTTQIGAEIKKKADDLQKILFPEGIPG